MSINEQATERLRQSLLGIQDEWAFTSGHPCDVARMIIYQLMEERRNLQARQRDYAHQWSQIAETLGGDARDVPDPYEKTMAGRVAYEFAVLTQATETG